MAKVFVPDAVFLNGRFARGATLPVSDDGRVLSLPPPGAETVKLPGKVILPGLVNAHSHAFQRVLRGRTEYLAQKNSSDDFWSWRERMYSAATSLGPDGIYAASKQAFVEMLLAGITTVGEFHYLHHQPDGTPYSDPLLLSKQVVRAAREAGLRIVLLRVAYARSGFSAAANPRQRRFYTPDPEVFLKHTADLRTQLARDSGVTLGIAPHSVRALDKTFLLKLAELAPNEITHAHVAEQPAEIKACLAEHGRTPVELFDEVGLLHRRFTAVHGVHLEYSEMERLAREQATVCACPSTEANLGDGIVPADQLGRAGVRLCLGSDSQAQIDLLHEARSLENHLRLFRQRRAVLDGVGAEPAALAQRLFAHATHDGARSLGLETGTLSIGEPADFFTVELQHPSLAGASLESLLPSLVFAAPPGAIRDVAVDGELRVRDGRHPEQDKVSADFSQLMGTL